MFVSGSHFSGGVAAGATPVISGPRHWGQLPSAASRATADAAKEATQRAVSGTSFSVILNSMAKLAVSYQPSAISQTEGFFFAV
jgi:hypothetical protein